MLGLSLVALYDIENTRGADTDFHLYLAADLDARTILDRGCGAGALLAKGSRIMVFVARRIRAGPAPACAQGACWLPAACRAAVIMVSYNSYVTPAS
jgi:hypothetical protein